MCTINTAIRRAARGAMPVAVTASVLATGLAACGTVEQLSAAQKVSKAFGKVGDGKSAGFKLSIDATPEQILAFDKATGAGNKGLVGTATGGKGAGRKGSGGGLDEQSAKAMSGLALSVAISADKPLKDIEAFKSAAGSGGSNDLTLDRSVRVSYVLSDRSGTALLEYRQVDAKGYLHVDAKGLVKLTGEDPSQVDAAGNDLPADLGAVKDVLAGKWVALDLQELADAAKKSDGRKAAPSPVPSADPEAAKQLLNSLKDVLGRTVTYEDKGTKDGADHIWMSAPARQLVDELFKAVRPVADKFPQQLGKFPAQAPTDVPDRKVGVDLYLKNGALSSATFDLAQLQSKVEPGVNFPVKLAFDQSAPDVQAPAGATKLTSDDLMKAVLGLAAGPGAGLDPKDAGGAPPLTPAAPLTDAQLKELAKLGVPEEQARAFNTLGMTFEDIKEIAQEG
ncbi:hypothetical protein BX285_4540 [Streptomyces sp. 1114.5]|uniref:hypothetical protein n=1 Tax=unclassified Streptomyces TaxID=2593676 RepID=UPI000BD7197C|nr:MULTISPECIES: hypothetical protein [unclassified Streptomyces]RKT20060.1 hypothetical protein BX285_4540 [Streptomyces sp. 1114.5]SOB86248.1 hypothetical protein SAMN06272789_6558 [Streptomyces sp. 1331.2]